MEDILGDALFYDDKEKVTERKTWLSPAELIGKFIIRDKVINTFVLEAYGDSSPYF